VGVSSEINSDDLPDLSSVPQLPMRPPTLCKGCPHTESYMRVKEAIKDLGIEENTIYPTDIGCYTLGLLPPIQMADYLLCMGSSIGSSAGFSVSTDQKIVAFIGDSTFFHSGITSLVNAVFNNHNLCLVVLDNSTTAMTGHQPNPGMSIVPDDYDKTHVPIENVIKGIGIKNLFKINPYKKEESHEIIKEALQKTGVSVILSESPCILYYKKLGGKK
jgi:indolepyruvate ferredoxin oxidoreductase alpha subunit